MKSNLEYQLRKVYDRFKLYSVYKKMKINNRIETVFLYQTTFSTIKIWDNSEQERKQIGGMYGRD